MADKNKSDDRPTQSVDQTATEELGTGSAYGTEPAVMLDADRAPVLEPEYTPDFPAPGQTNDLEAARKEGVVDSTKADTIRHDVPGVLSTPIGGITPGGAIRSD
jgi:hypothetical protein